jgi:hypothetical protein
MKVTTYRVLDIGQAEIGSLASMVEGQGGNKDTTTASSLDPSDLDKLASLSQPLRQVQSILFKDLHGQSLLLAAFCTAHCLLLCLLPTSVLQHLLA